MDIHQGSAVLLNYFSFDDIANFSEICTHIQAMHRLPWDRVVRLPVYAFGRADSLSITIADSPKDANEIRFADMGVRLASISEISVHYGTVIDAYPEPFDPEEVVLTRPVIGVVTFKVREEAWEAIYRRFADIGTLRAQASALFRKAIVKAVRQQRLDPSDVRAVLVLSYGAEDAQAIIFCRCLELVKRFVTDLRRLTLSDFLGKGGKGLHFKHAIRSSETILGFHWPYDNIRAAERRQARPGLASPISLSATTLISSRPGHMQHALNSVHSAMRYATRRSADHEFFVRPIVGRNDIMLSRRHRYPNGSFEFFAEHLRFVHKLLNRRSIVRIETCIGFPGLKRLEGRKKPAPSGSRRSGDLAHLERLKMDVWASRRLTPGERESFMAILTRLHSLHYDKYMGDYLDTLTAAIGHSMTRYIALTPWAKAVHGIELDLWMSHIELAFASRNAGSPPVAETASAGFMTRCASSQKFLKLLDYIAECFMASLEAHLSKRRFTRMFVTTNNQTGSGASCFRASVLLSAFIALPSTSIFHPMISLYSFMHEMGHVVFDCLVASKELSPYYEKAADRYFLSEARRKMCCTFEDAIAGDREAFAEFFAVWVLANGDFSSHARNIRAVTAKHLGTAEVAESTTNTIKAEHISRARVLFENTTGDKISGDMFRTYMLAIAEWHDGLFSGIRRLVHDEFAPDAFWDLWIQVNNRLN